MKSIIVMTVAAMTTLGCVIGKSAKDASFARSAAGAAVIVSVPGRNFTGELIALQQSGMVISSSNQLQLVPYPIIVAMQIKELGSTYAVSRYNPLTPDKRERLRLVSHFPQGLTPEIERKLLESLGQAAMDTIR
jgi:hypothetical protein